MAGNLRSSVPGHEPGNTAQEQGTRTSRLGTTGHGRDGSQGRLWGLGGWLAHAWPLLTPRALSELGDACLGLCGSGVSGEVM